MCMQQHKAYGLSGFPTEKKAFFHRNIALLNLLQFELGFNKSGYNNNIIFYFIPLIRNDITDTINIHLPTVFHKIQR